MGVKFIDGSEATGGPPVVVIYGPPGAGKTSLALTSSKPALLDFDGGAHRAANKAGKAILPINNWSDVQALERSDLEDFDTLVVDTVGECLECMSRGIIQSDPSFATGGSLTLRGYGRLKTQFTSWLGLLRSFDLTVVLLAHMDEQQRGDRIMERIIAAGSSKNLIYQKADLMGRILVGEKGHYMTFDPGLTAYGKNPGLPSRTKVPHPDKDPTLMARIIAAARAKIAEKAQAPKQAKQEQEKPKQAKQENVQPSYPQNAEGLSELAAEMKEAGATNSEKLALVKYGKSLGFNFDKATMTFFDPDEEAF